MYVCMGGAGPTYHGVASGQRRRPGHVHGLEHACIEVQLDRVLPLHVHVGTQLLVIRIGEVSPRPALHRRQHVRRQGRSPDPRTAVEVAVGRGGRRVLGEARVALVLHDVWPAPALGPEHQTRVVIDTAAGGGSGRVCGGSELFVFANNVFGRARELRRRRTHTQRERESRGDS